MEIINISPMKIKFPYANSELGLRPEPKETDADWKDTLDLLEDIRNNGMSDLFSVRPLGNDEYEVINGSRRTKACQLLCAEGHPDYQQIPVQISNIDEITSLERQVAGNATVKATNTKQYAASLVKIALHQQYDVTALAKAVGKSESFVNNMLRFNRLPEAIQDLVAAYKMPVTNAIAMTKLPKDLDLLELMEDACTMDTNAFGIRVKEAVDAYAAEKKALKGGQEPKFELTEKRISNDQIKANLEKAKNLVEDDSSEFNRGYLFAYEEIFQIDEKAAVERKTKWDSQQEAKKLAKEARKADTEAKKKRELAEYVKKNNITDLSQLTA